MHPPPDAVYGGRLAVGPDTAVTAPAEPVPGQEGYWKYVPVFSYYQPTYFEDAGPTIAVFKHLVMTAVGDAAFNNVRLATPGDPYLVKAVYMGMDPAGAVIPDNRTYVITADITWIPVPEFAPPPPA